MNNFIKTPFRWYYSTDRTKNYQNIAKEFQHNKIYPDSGWRLLSQEDRLLPFQFFIPIADAVYTDLVATEWILVNAATGSTVSLTALIPSMLSLFQVMDNGLWWTYIGDPIGLTISCGMWYSAIQFGSRWVVSEQFQVVDDNVLDKGTKMEWSHSCDTAGIIYHDGYKNLIYLIDQPESLAPVIYEEGVENANKQFIPSKTVYTPQYQYSDVVPEYIVEALNAVRLHSDQSMTYRPFSIDPRTFKIQVRDVQQVWDVPKVALLTMKLEMNEILIGTGCCDDLTESALFPLVTGPDTYKIATGNAFTDIPLQLSVLKNDTGYAISAQSGTIFTSDGATITMHTDGTFRFAPGSPSYTGTDSFNYVAQDGFGNTVSGSVTLIVDETHAVADSYLASAITPTTHYPASVGLLANDFFPFTYTIAQPIYVLGGATSQTIMSDEADGNFIVVDNVTGAFTYHLIVIPTGGISHFKYKIFIAPGVVGPDTAISIEVA